MPSLYARHAMVVAPSAWPDPLPGAVLEARALQRALLVSDQGGIPEIVQGYRPLRVVPMPAPREQVVQGLRLALSQASEWARRQPDPKEEALFRQRHAPQAHASAVITALERAIALARRPAPSTPPKA